MKKPDPPSNPEGMATVKQVADFLQCSTDTVYRMVAENKIKSIRLRDAIRIPWTAVNSM